MPKQGSATDEPWLFGPEPVYNSHADASQTLRGLVHAPSNMSSTQRTQLLKDWGQKREAEMHRPPLWCMDQLCSGSGFFPPRHLHDDWFSAEELQMISALEHLLGPTGHAAMLARDMMALRIYDVDIRIIADDSGSMQCGMLRSYGFGNPGWTPDKVQKVFGRRAFKPDNLAVFSSCPFRPTTPRWELLKDHLTKWEEIFKILGIERKVYFLNNRCDPTMSMEEILRNFAGGGTPMGSTFARVLGDYKREHREQNRPLLILALTDGEANDKDMFNDILDEIQDGIHGDVQVCLMGLSLEPEDIEWFEDEECDDTRIRTIEAWEVEQQMILYRKVIPRTTDYSFAMHVYRALVTNYFPADYDYEAPIQTLRHRLYITLHALDRRFTGERDAKRPNGMPMAIADTVQTAAIAAVLGLLACGVKAFACAVGLGACAVGYSSRAQNNTKSRNVGADAVLLEEGLNDTDDALIGTLVRQLQQLSLGGRQTSVYVGANGECNVSGYRYGRSGYRNRPWISSSQLDPLQRAIGTLSPNEVQMRDLQFQDVSFNNRVLEVALKYLRQAVEL